MNVQASPSTTDRSSARLKVMVLAGEPSSDAHAAEVIQELQTRVPELKCFGMGGTALRAAGAELIVDSESQGSVMGFVEVLGHIGILLRARKQLLAVAERERPDVAILVDFPDFNLIMARGLKKLGIKIVYYVSPQLWAWRRGRVKTVKKYVDRMLPIFPFEEAFYREHGVTAQYVGHPFLGRAPLAESEAELRKKFDLSADAKVLALLPGSRKPEIERLLEPQLDAFERLKQDVPSLEALLPIAPGISEEWLRSSFPRIAHLDVRVSKLGTRRVLAVADVACVASGTASLETALACVPAVVVYKLVPLTYSIARFLVRGVKHFAMANLVAEKQVVPELLQSEVTGQNIAKVLRPLLTDEELHAQKAKELALVGEKLQHGAPQGQTVAEVAATEILAVVS